VPGAHTLQHLNPLRARGFLGNFLKIDFMLLLLAKLLEITPINQIYLER
jgi:hypothetical protein